MHLSRLLLFLVSVYFVDCKNNVKTLTDSMGQDVIEIGTPIKELQELPPGVEEEPSAEVDEDPSTKPPPSATRRETKRVVTTTSTSKSKEVDKEESISQEDEEVRIEKELAEIYKDTDYKSESSETPKDLKIEKNGTEEKPIARSRINFKFQPDVNNRQDIERFRTSVDEISCDRRVTQKLNAENSKSNSTSEFIMSFIQIGLVVLSLVICY